MKVGDLVKRKRRLEFSRLKDFNTLAIIVGFDHVGDLHLRYVNSSELWENEEDIDYKSAWELVNATN
tara:strand:+ start:408 stop:608 length:201 start_codon:yes stop_codon:yes gene_type:complete